VVHAYSLLQRVLKAADSVLDLAHSLVGLALSLQLGITCRLADGFLDRALDLFRRSRLPIFIYRDFSSTANAHCTPRQAARA
jgi:hypothetical protein